MLRRRLRSGVVRRPLHLPRRLEGLGRGGALGHHHGFRSGRSSRRCRARAFECLGEAAHENHDENQRRRAPNPENSARSSPLPPRRSPSGRGPSGRTVTGREAAGRGAGAAAGAGVGVGAMSVLVPASPNPAAWARALRDPRQPPLVGEPVAGPVATVPPARGCHRVRAASESKSRATSSMIAGPIGRESAANPASRALSQMTLMVRGTPPE